MALTHLGEDKKYLKCTLYFIIIFFFRIKNSEKLSV